MRLTADGKKTVFVAGGFGPDGPQPPARGKCFEQFVAGVRGGQPQSFLHASGSWRHTGPGEMADCSQSPSLRSR